MTDRGLLDLIIARLPELSFREKLQLCETLGGEGDLIRKSRPDIEALIGHKLSGFWDIDSMRQLAENDAKTAALRQIRWVPWSSPEYPPLLREIYDPPVLLFYRGKLPNPEKPLVAIVGTRKPSAHAAMQAFDIAKGLAACGISVVSGLALGIDAMAHRGTIEGGAASVAVLGSGVDALYPSSNRTLARRLLDTGGVIFSEYPPGTGPRKWNFPARNRIISGIARGVLIVEAPQKSGALITARFALDQNRDLWVASTGSTASSGLSQVNAALCDRRGTIKLAQDGAVIIHRASDILGAWNINVTKED